MIINGVTLPDIPAEVLASYPYAIVFHLSTGYMAYLNKEPYCYVSTDKTGIAMNFLFAASAYRYCALDSANDESWDFNDSVNDGPQIATQDVVWSNHDIYYATAFDQTSMTATVGTEIYFSSSVHPERVSIGRSLVDGFATQVQRLTGTTDQMNAVQIQEKLSAVKAGIKIGDVVLPAFPERWNDTFIAVCYLSNEETPYVALAGDGELLHFSQDDYGIIGTKGNGIVIAQCTPGAAEWEMKTISYEGYQYPKYTGSGICWSNHDIYEITSINEDTGEFTTGDVYCLTSQNFNGVWLPKIPEDVLAEYPYAAIYKELFPTGEFRFALCVSKTQMLFIPSDLAVELAGISGTEGLIYNKYAYRAFCENENTAWGNFEVFDNKFVQYQGQMGVAVGGISGYTYTWPYANHDIYKTTSIDSSTGEITTGDLYFPPLPAIDSDRVSIGYDLFNDIVEQIQRLSNNEEKMNALRAYWKLTTVV